MTAARLAPSAQQFNQQTGQARDEWWRAGIIYEIYPRSFQDSGDDGIGDLRGIQERLPYLQAIGVDAIWITPFFRSPMADFGYDVSDYCDVDPIFGTLADFDALLAAAHALGIRVIVDFVPNHTSDQHPWFLEARRSRDNPRRDWYIWRDGAADGGPPNNWDSFFDGGAWTLDPTTGQYYLHMFLPQQPDLNWRHPAVRQAMYDVLRFWLDRGVDGFRLDAVTILIKDEQFPDMPTDDDVRHYGADLLLRLVAVHNQPELHPILRDFRAILDSYPGDRVLIAETGARDFHELMEFCGPTLDEIQLPMNLNTLQQPWDAAALRASISAYYAALQPGAAPNFVFGNHDQSRFATRYGASHHRSVNCLLLTLWGTPTLYYGDELGMPDGHILPEQRRDPFQGHHAEFGLGRDPERTPMQWDDSPNGGFTRPDVMPWLPMFTTFASSVARQQDDPTSSLNFFIGLTRLRRAHPALTRGSITFIDGGGDDLLIYLRQWNTERLLIVINFGSTDHHLDITGFSDRCAALLSSSMDAGSDLSPASIPVRPHESLILKLA